MILTLDLKNSNTNTLAHSSRSNVVKTPTELSTFGPFVSATLSICRITVSSLLISHGSPSSSSNGINLKNRPWCKIMTWLGHFPSSSKNDNIAIAQFHLSVIKMTRPFFFINFDHLLTCHEIVGNLIHPSRPFPRKSSPVEEESELMHCKWGSFAVFIRWCGFFSQHSPKSKIEVNISSYSKVHWL